MHKHLKWLLLLSELTLCHYLMTLFIPYFFPSAKVYFYDNKPLPLFYSVCIARLSRSFSYNFVISLYVRFCIYKTLCNLFYSSNLTLSFLVGLFAPDWISLFYSLLIFWFSILFMFSNHFICASFFLSYFCDSRGLDAKTFHIVTQVFWALFIYLIGIFLLHRLDNFYWSTCKFNDFFVMFILLLNPSVEVFLCVNLFLFLKCPLLHFYSFYFIAHEFSLPTHFKTFHPYFIKHGWNSYFKVFVQ